jgi:hypothetical protein
MLRTNSPALANLGMRSTVDTALEISQQFGFRDLAVWSLSDGVGARCGIAAGASDAGDASLDE